MLDGHSISPPEGFLIRKGPGNCHFDFAQEILFLDYLQPQLMNRLQRRYSSIFLVSEPLLLVQCLYSLLNQICMRHLGEMECFI